MIWGVTGASKCSHLSTTVSTCKYSTSLVLENELKQAHMRYITDSKMYCRKLVQIQIERFPDKMVYLRTQSLTRCNLVKKTLKTFLGERNYQGTRRTLWWLNVSWKVLISMRSKIHPRKTQVLRPRRRHALNGLFIYHRMALARYVHARLQHLIKDNACTHGFLYNEFQLNLSLSIRLRYGCENKKELS